MLDADHNQFAESLAAIEAANGRQYSKIVSYNVNQYFRESTKEKKPQGAGAGVLLQMKKELRDAVFTLRSKWTSLKFRNRGPVLFFTSDYTHSREMIPLALVLKKRYNLDCLFCTHKSTLYKVLIGKQQTVYIAPARSTRRMALEVNRLSGVDTRIKEIMEANFHSNLEWEKRAKNYVKSLNPSLIINGNDLLPEQRILNEIGKELKIPTCTMQHGAMSASLGIYHYSNSDFWSVYGSYAKDVLMKQGIEANRIFITGSNYMQSVQAGSDQTDDFYRKLGLQKGEAYVAVMFSGHGHTTKKENYLKQLEAVKLLAKKHENVKFILKMHPKESLDDVKVIDLPNISIIPHSLFVSLNIDLLQLLASSKAIISGLSATVNEAFFLDIPVFTLDFAGDYSSAEIITQKLTMHCQDQETFEATFSRFLKEPESFESTLQKARQFAKAYFYSGEGKMAAEIQAERVLELIERNNNLSRK